MGKAFLIAIFLMAISSTYAQISNELLVGNRQAHYISYWQKDIDKLGKYNLFNLNRFVRDFKDVSYSNLSMDIQVSCRMNKWFGISTGAGYNGEIILPNIGFSLSFRNKKEDFFIEAFPTVGITKQITPSIFAIVGYNPKIKHKWGLSNQLIFTLNVISSSQLIRLGLNFKDKFQFGIGADINYFYENKPSIYNFGAFIRLNL